MLSFAKIGLYIIFLNYRSVVITCYLFIILNSVLETNALYLINLKNWFNFLLQIYIKQFIIIIQSGLE